MAYLSLYRKYRSQSFGDLIGQDHVVRGLTKAIESGRIAQTYLFTGPRGTGKTSSARLLAKALCCEDGPRADFDEESPICREITAGTCIDVIEMDAASDAGVDDVRERIVEVAEYRPMICRYKVFIIDEVHDLSPKAFDALLKTVEEPPPHLIFILATTEYSKVPPTIRSRCQKYEFHRASMKDLVARLEYVSKAEGIEVEPAAITAIARMADGGYRDALTLLEQAILTAEDGRVALRSVYDQLGLVPEETVDTLLDAIRTGDVPGLVGTLEEVARMGRDPRALLESILHRLSDLTRAAHGMTAGGDDAGRDASLHETAARLGRDMILRLRGALAETHRAIRDVTLPRIWLESELIRISRLLAAPAVSAPAVVAPAAVVAAPVVVVAAPVEAPVRKRVLGENPPSAREEPPVPEPPTAEPPPADTLDAVWARILEGVPATTTIGKKLASARLGRGPSGALRLEMGRQMDQEWLTENPKRFGHVRKLLTEAGLGYELEVTVAPRENGPAAEGGAVELPAEGNRLEKLARSVFELDGPAPDGER